MKDRFCVERGATVAQTLEILTDYQSFTSWLRTMPDYIMRWREDRDYTGLRVDLPDNIDVQLARDSIEKRHKLLWSHLEGYDDLELADGRPLKVLKDDLLAGRCSLALKPKPSRHPTSDEILKSLHKAGDPAIFYGA